MTDKITPDGEYDDDVKQMCWEWAWLGYKWGYGVEEMEHIDYRAARENFEQQWNRRMDQ